MCRICTLRGVAVDAKSVCGAYPGLNAIVADPEATHMTDSPTGEDIKFLLVRLESKVDTVLARHEIRLDQHDSNHSDHESRLRSLEMAIHQLATKTDIEDIERKRDSELASRQKKTMSWLMVALAVLVPLESAIVAWIIQELRA